MTVSTPDDRELIKAYLRGDAAAVATIEQWIGRAAHSYRRRLAHCWEDVIQDLQLELFRLLDSGRFRGDSRLRTYLWRVVNHSCLDRLRRLERRPQDELDEEQGLHEPAARAAGDRRRWHESRDLVERVLRRLSDECLRLWRMILAGHSYREMSAELGVAEGTLRVRVMRCRRRALEVRRELLADVL